MARMVNTITCRLRNNWIDYMDSKGHYLDV